MSDIAHNKHVRGRTPSRDMSSRHMFRATGEPSRPLTLMVGSVRLTHAPLGSARRRHGRMFRPSVACAGNRGVDR